MACPSCRSAKHAELTAEMLIHFPGLGNIDKPGVWLFPTILVCMDCGSSRFTVPENELASVAKGSAANNSSLMEDTAGDVASGSGWHFR